MTAGIAGTVEAALAAADGVEGWMTDAQARRLFAAAARVGAPGRIVEIGSYRGRSAIVLAHAAAEGVEVVAIDPHAGNDRGPQQWEGTEEQGAGDHAAFEANLRRAGVSDRVRHVRRFSSEALGDVPGPIAMLYVDGAHGYRPALADLVDWGARVSAGGTMLVHDSFASVGVTLALLRSVTFGDRWTYAGRSGSLAEFRRTDPPPRARLRSAARQLGQLPWFVRNVLIKAAILARAWPVVRALGHQDRTWPY